MKNTVEEKRGKGLEIGKGGEATDPHSIDTTQMNPADTIGPAAPPASYERNESA